MLRFGTSYFVTRETAERYYAIYGYSRADVARKLRDGEIHVGLPPLKPNERPVMIDDRMRWAVEVTSPSFYNPVK